MGTFKGNASRLPEVTNISGNEITIGRKTYLVDESARITVDGEKTDFSAIKVGMRAMVTGKVLARGKTTAESLYSEGQASFAGIVETLSAWHHAELGALRARADLAQGIAELERLMGAPFEWEGVPGEGP